MNFSETKRTTLISARRLAVEEARDELLDSTCKWLNRASRKPERLNSVVLLRLLVEDARAGLNGGTIEERLRKEAGWAKRQIGRLRKDLDSFRKGYGAGSAWRF